MSSKVELRSKSREELVKTLDELRNELSQLRVAQVTQGTATKLAKIKQVRKSIARVLTVYNQTRKLSIRAEFKKSKYRPLDLRPKLTRAIRRSLTPHQAAAMTLRTKKRAPHRAIRKYAIKA